MRALALATAAAAVVLAAPAAYADTWTHTDAAGDARVVDRDSGDDTVSAPARDPRERRGDLTRVTARHGAEAVKVAISVRATAPIPMLTVTLATSRGDKLRVFYSPYESDRDDYVVLRRYGREVPCDDLTVHETSAGYLATIPRSCLGNPYRVRLGVQTHSYAPDGDVVREIQDDALRTARVDLDAPRLGPWVVADR